MTHVCSFFCGGSTSSGLVFCQWARCWSRKRVLFSWGGGSFRVGSLCYLSYSGQWSALCEFYGWCRDFASRGDVLCAVAGWCIVQIIFSDRLSPRGEQWCLYGCIYVGVCVNCSPSLPTQIVRTPRPHGGFGSRSPTYSFSLPTFLRAVIESCVTVGAIVPGVAIASFLLSPRFPATHLYETFPSFLR